MKTLVSLSASPILYHILDINTATSVLTSNEIVLPAAGSTHSEKLLNKDHDYYFSMTRHNLGKYSVQSASANKVIFNLDGISLSNNYKIIPVDYWGADFRKSAKGDYEAEDRLITNKPTIKNARKYVTSVRVLFKSERGTRYNERSDSDSARLRKFLIAAKKFNIPVRAYTDTQAFLLDDARRAVSTKDLDLSGKTPAPYYRYKRSELAAYMELYHGTDKTGLTKDANYILDRIRYKTGKEAAVALQNILHSDRSSREPMLRHRVEAFFKFLRANKLSIESFMDQLIAKWRKL